MTDIAIRVSNLSKCYQIYDNPRDRFKQLVIPKLPGISTRRDTLMPALRWKIALGDSLDWPVDLVIKEPGQDNPIYNLAKAQGIQITERKEKMQIGRGEMSLEELERLESLTIRFARLADSRSAPL